MLEIETLKSMVQRSSDLTEAARTEAEKARDYYDGEQLSADQKAEYARRRMPPIVNNRIQRKVDAMVGIEQQGRTDPRAFPREPGDESAADVATKALVFVDDLTRFDAKRSQAFENLLIEGYGGVEVGVEEKRGRFEVVVNRLRWEEIFYDPASREKDFSDAMFLGVMKWMTLDQAEALYGGSYSGDGELTDLLQATMSGVGSSYDDRPRDGAFQWADVKLKRVRIAQMYYRKGGEWFLCVFTGGGEIVHQPSPYLDEDGKTTCPLILMTAYVDRKNQRYGVVKSLIPMQDEVNARRQRILQMAFQRQTMGLKGAVEVTALKREMAKPDGHVEIDADVAEGSMQAGMKPFDIIPQADQIAAQFNLLTESKDEIDKLGPNASLLGQLSGQQSGRAIMAQQQAGMAELAPIYDSLRDWTLRVYRAMWNRIRQFWTEERYIRITEDNEAAQFVPVNQFQGFAMDQTGAVVPQVENALAEMDVDIIIDSAPDMATLQHEQFQQLSDMAQAGMPIPPNVLIEASSLRNKRKLLEMLEQQNAQGGQQQAQAAQVQMEGAQAQSVLRQAQARKAEAEAIQTELETQQIAEAGAIAAAMQSAAYPAAGGF